MRIACWINKATDTHAEYVIIIAFPLQQWLHECATMLRYTHIACRVLYMVFPSARQPGVFRAFLVLFVLMAFCTAT